MNKTTTKQMLVHPVRPLNPTISKMCFASLFQPPSASVEFVTVVAAESWHEGNTVSKAG